MLGTCLAASIFVTSHIGFVNEYNDIHPNVWCQVNDTVKIGAYYNSESTISPYIGYEIDITEDVSIDVGLVGGYEGADVLPMARINYKSFFAAPGAELVNDKLSPGLVIGYEFKF